MAKKKAKKKKKRMTVGLLRDSLALFPKDMEVVMMADENGYYSIDSVQTYEDDYFSGPVISLGNNL